MEKVRIMYMFDYLRRFLETEDTKVLFILALICVAMIIDFLTGTIAAKINPEITFASKAGVNGILRKVASIVLLVFFIPVSILIPLNAGIAMVYTLYLGYLMMEIKSILENYKKMGNATELFDNFMNAFKKGDK